MPKYKPYRVNGRFYISSSSDGPCVVDDIDGSVIDWDTVRECRDFASFCRDYVRLHGDIDLQSVPYSIGDPLHYAPLETRDDDRYIMNTQIQRNRCTTRPRRPRTRQTGGKMKKWQAERLQALIERGFDNCTVRDSVSIKIRCSQCQATVINGVACHETGCPNQVKQIPGDGYNTLFYEMNGEDN